MSLPVTNRLESAHMKTILSHRRTAKTQASLYTCTVSPEPSLFAHAINGITEI